MKLDSGSLTPIIFFKSGDKLAFILTWTAVIFTANVLLVESSASPDLSLSLRFLISF